jgi:hypothetical protein
MVEEVDYFWIIDRGDGRVNVTAPSITLFGTTTLAMARQV